MTAFGFLTQTLLEQAKQQAAFRAVDENVKSGDRVGVGSGSTVVYAVERLAEHQQARRLKNIVCVPSSFQAEQVLERSHCCLLCPPRTPPTHFPPRSCPPCLAQLIVEHGLTLSNLSITPELDIAIDGADETDDALNAIKGVCMCEWLVVHCQGTAASSDWLRSLTTVPSALQVVVAVISRKRWWLHRQSGL